MLLGSTNVLVINVLSFILENVTVKTESFFIYKLEYLFIFSDMSFKIPGSNPLYNKNKPCLKISFDLFLS